MVNSKFNYFGDGDAELIVSTAMIGLGDAELIVATAMVGLADAELIYRQATCVRRWNPYFCNSSSSSQ